MSAVIQELRVRNFEGYKDADLKFSAGLNLIRGRNAAGKSTILDAIGFALFGDIPDVNKSLLVSRLPDARTIEVYIKFSSPRGRETVEVTRKGGLDYKGAYKAEQRTLRVNGKEVDLESDEDLRGKVTELLGVNFRTFSSLVYVRQGRLTTILEPPKEQMDAVIGITLLRELREQLDAVRMELGKYEGKDAATEAQNLERIMIPQLKSEAESLAADVQTLEGEVHILGETVKKAESSQLIKLLQQAEEKDKLDVKMREIQIKIEELLRNAGAASDSDLGMKIRDCADREKQLKETEDALIDRVGKLLELWMNAKGKANELQSGIDEHERLLSKNISKCPTCGQNIKAASMKVILKSDKTKVDKLRQEEKARQHSYQAANAELEDTERRSLNTQRDRTAYEGVKKSFDQYSAALTQAKDGRVTILPLIERALSELGLELAPDDPELKLRIAQQLPVQPGDLVKMRKDLADKQAILNGKSIRRNGLQDRLRMHETTLNKLKQRSLRAVLAKRLTEEFDQGVEARRRMYMKRIEHRALEFYKAMTDQHTYSTVSIDPEDYMVSVHPRGMTEQIPATRVGGGHQTLIALAVRLALLEEVKFRALLILDEPTYGVDSANLPQLASQLGEASRQISQMILVTHHNICEEEASNIIEVTVQEDGASRAAVEE